MVRSVFLIFFGAAVFTYGAWGDGNLLPEDLTQAFINHVQTAVDQCGEDDASVVNDVSACIAGLNSLPQRAPPTKESLFGGLEEFVNCLDPYKKMLQGCSAATTRDNDLVALDIGKSLLKDDGALFLELALKLRAADIPRPEECSIEETEGLGMTFEDCMQEVGVADLAKQFREDWVVLLENLCSTGSGVRTCVNRFKSTIAGSPCEDYMSSTSNAVLEVFRKLESASEYSDVFSRCFAFRTA